MRYVWATPDYSVFEITDTLDRLRVSYSYRHQGRMFVIDNKHNQPKWVHVSTDIKDVRKGSVNFITASHAELSLTQFPRFDINTCNHKGRKGLYPVLKHLLINPVLCDQRITKMDVLDYVNQISKPSLLNKIQTIIYKIQPYSLRKETQGLILDYFCSRISSKRMVHALKRSLKTSGLIPYIEQGVEMREAVARLGSESVEAVSEQTGIPTFELLYLSKQRVEKPKKRK